MRVTVIGGDTSHEIDNIRKIRELENTFDILIPETSDDVTVLQNIPLEVAVVTLRGQTHTGEITGHTMLSDSFAFRVKTV